MDLAIERNLVPPYRYPRYPGISSAIVKQVFYTAMRMRYQSPTAEKIQLETKTSLDLDIVAAILEGALRVLPPDNSAQGTSFIHLLRHAGLALKDEGQQKRDIKQQIEAGHEDVATITPDVLFLSPTEVCGRTVKWIEYKDMFGFKKNPFIHKKHVKQVRRYKDQFGDGMIVYKLGFEEKHIVQEGVHCFLEAEIISWAQ
ncbi:hypothetical protein KVT40_001446 [Elsinoe batatas]|uniref:CDAN1-interacting nuclease 1 n=1 Tax=Elsinoe batatas TaxID=2601811 RepID=A0A8K0L5Z6_9PEZI|nr:hypothetical protein KVT40_001446 [Elsinoe batatas]